MTMIYTGTTISFQSNNKFHQAHSSHPKFQEIVALCKAGDFNIAATLVDLKAVVTAALKGSSAELRDSNVYYKGEVIRSTLATRIITMTREGFSVEPLLLFLENLMSNPSKRAVDELYGFLEASGLPITDDGHFLAYKSVRQDYKDHHSGTMDNSVGQVVSMERNKVDEDKDRTCSYGLHFAAHEYAAGFGASGRMVVLKINPKDVVAIPSDYSNQKGRCARYEVVEEVERSDTKLVQKAFVDTGIIKAKDTKVTFEKPLKFPVGTKVYIREDSEYFTVNSFKPKGVEGIVTSSSSDFLGILVKWKNGSTNSYSEDDLTTETPFVPEEDNFKDPTRWKTNVYGELTFIGKASQFPVNRDVAYSLERKSTGKAYRGDFFFTNYDKAHDNLVFTRMGFDGTVDRYVTVGYVSDWEITRDLTLA